MPEPEDDGKNAEFFDTINARGQEQWNITKGPGNKGSDQGGADEADQKAKGGQAK